METPRSLRWVILGGGLACGARTGLEVPYDTAHGGEAPVGGGGGSGGSMVVTCDELEATPPAHVRLPNSAATVLSVELIRPPSAPGLACIVSDVANDDGTFDVAHGCFEAWGMWPGSLGTAFLSPGSDGGVAATEGRTMGYAILLGNRKSPALFTALDVPPNQSEVPWTSVDMETPGFRAAFVARAPDGAFFGGLSHMEGTAEHLGVLEVGTDGAEHLAEVACAKGALSADAVATHDDVVIVSSTGHTLGTCPSDGPFAPPSRLQVVALGRGGGSELRYELEHEAPVVSVRATPEGDGAWVAWESGGAVSVVAIGHEGAKSEPTRVAEGSRGAVALARRGDATAVAYVERGPDGEPLIRVVEVDDAGDLHLLAEVESMGATWLRDLEMIVDPPTGNIIVAYVGRIGSSERAFARRLACP